MKRARDLFPRIADRENLRWATHCALRGKRSRQDARAFVANLDAELSHLQSGLWDESIELGVCRQFQVCDPKRRLITAPCFRERVLHHAIMLVCEPILERSLIDDTFACRRGKGRVACLRRAVQFSCRFPAVLQLDNRKYFDSISHERLLRMLEGKFNE